MAQNGIVPPLDMSTRPLVQVPPPPAPPRLPTTKYDPLFAAEGLRTRIDPMLLKAVGWQESSISPTRWNSVRNPRTGKLDYYKGLMELSAANQQTIHVTDPYNAGQSVAAGASYLAHCLWQQDGDVRRALQQYNGSPFGEADDDTSYAGQVFKKYKDLTAKSAPDFLSIFVRPHATRGPGPAPDMTPAPDFERGPLGDPMLDSQGNLFPKHLATLAPGPVATPIQSPPPPMLRPEPTETPAPSVHLNMNTGPSGRPNFVQNRPDPPTMAQPWPPMANKAGVQPAAALAGREPVLPPLPSSQPPSPFVQAFLTNAIFGGSPALPFALGAGIRPGGTGWR